MAYGSTANWSGTAQEGPNEIVWEVVFGFQAQQEAAAERSNSYGIPQNAGASAAALDLKNAWNANPANANDQVTQSGTEVTWDLQGGRVITKMSFTVNGGPEQVVPDDGRFIAVVPGLRVQSVS